MSQRQEKSTYFNSSFLKKSNITLLNLGFAHISHDHKHINAGNVSMTLYPDSAPKQPTNGYSNLKKK